MSTPTEDLPKKSSEEKQKTEAQKQKWSEFLGLLALPPIEKENLARILFDIAKDSFDTAAKIFTELTTDGALTLGEKLSEALELKKIQEEQIISFFSVQSLKKNPHLLFKQGFVLANFCNKTESNLGKIILPTYLINLVDLAESGEKRIAIEAYEALKANISAPTPAEIVEAYQSLNEKYQEVFLDIFFSPRTKSFGEVMQNKNFLYALKAANPQLFEKFCLSNLSEERRVQVNKALKNSDNPFISYMRRSDFNSAVEAFICHPGSPVELYKYLQENSQIFSESKILQFFSILLEKQLQKNIQFCFTAIRICFESSRYREVNPNLVSQMMLNFLKTAMNTGKTIDACEILSSMTTWNIEIVKAYKKCSDKEQKILLNNFMGAYKKSRNVTLLLEFRIMQPDFFEKMLSEQDKELQKTIRDSLAVASKESSNVVYEWTLKEEELLLNFNHCLEKLSKASNSFSSDMKDIIKGIDGMSMYPNLAKKAIELYLKRAIKLDYLKEACELLASHPSWAQHILGAYQSQSTEIQEKLFRHILEAAARKYNVVLICGLKDLNPPLFDKILLTQDEETIKTLKRLLMVPVPARLSVSNLMLQFSLPFREMLPFAAKIVCAETSQRKKRYSFSPTVLDSSELKAYLTLLKSRIPPIKGRFIVPAPGGHFCDHWIAGEVDIPKNGNPRLLLIDSLGSGESKTHDFIMTELRDMKELTIYLSDGARQITGAGCTVFALKDVQDLFTIGDYLDPKYNKDIFEYVSKNETGNVSNRGKTGKNESFPFSVYSALLPLRFMRSEQSKTRNLLDATIPKRSKEEQELPVNKKKETALQSSKKHFKTMNTKENEVNMRIEYKLNKMANHVLDYLVKHQFDLAQIEKETEPFTLKGLKKQIAVERSDTSNAAGSKELINKQQKEKQTDHQKETAGLYFQSSKLANQSEHVPQNQKKDTEKATKKTEDSPTKDTTPSATNTNEKGSLKK